MDRTPSHETFFSTLSSLCTHHIVAQGVARRVWHKTCSSTCHHMSERLLFPCFVFFLCLSCLYFLSHFYLFSVLNFKFHEVEHAEHQTQRAPAQSGVLPRGDTQPSHSKKQCTGNQVQHIAAQIADIDASARRIDQSMADIKVMIDSLLNMPGPAILIQANGAVSSIPDWTRCGVGMSTCDALAKTVLWAPALPRTLFPTTTWAPAMPEALALALQAMMSSTGTCRRTLSQLRLELQELSKWIESTRKCALNGKPNNVREAVCAKQRFDEKKAQIDALSSRLSEIRSRKRRVAYDVR